MGSIRVRVSSHSGLLCPGMCPIVEDTTLATADNVTTGYISALIYISCFRCNNNICRAICTEFVTMELEGSIEMIPYL